MIKFSLPLFASLIFISCGYFAITGRDDMHEGGKGIPVDPGSYNSSIIMGEVVGPIEGAGATMVLAYPLSFTPRSLTEYVLLDKPGPFMIYLPAGRYNVYTLFDFNNNGGFDDDEISGVFGGPDEVTVGEGEVKRIRIAADQKLHTAMRLPRKMFVMDDGREDPHQISNGDIIKFYDERFSLNNGKAGWWLPSLFMKVFGAHIYLTQEYDARKVPVLFIHGTQGCPHNWAYFFLRLDKKKYQPWFYYYPSGIRLPLASQLLHEALVNLKKKYHFTNIYIAAHSIGGLVAWHMLANYDLKEQKIAVDKLVTLASPWTGFEAAESRSIVPTKRLPCWIDIAPGSIFLKRTLSAKIPPSVNYYLFYGKEDRIAQGRALDDRILSGATGKYGYDVDHDSILKDRTVFVQFSKLLSGR